VLLLHGKAIESAFPNEIPFCGSFSYVVDTNSNALLQSFVSVPCSTMAISIIIIHVFAPK
jgi:hypothetical protein